MIRGFFQYRRLETGSQSREEKGHVACRGRGQLRGGEAPAGPRPGPPRRGEAPTQVARGNGVLMKTSSGTFRQLLPAARAPSPVAKAAGGFVTWRPQTGQPASLTTARVWGQQEAGASARGEGPWPPGAVHCARGGQGCGHRPGPGLADPAGFSRGARRPEAVRFASTSGAAGPAPAARPAGCTPPAPWPRSQPFGGHG